MIPLSIYMLSAFLKFAHKNRISVTFMLWPKILTFHLDFNVEINKN